MSYEAGDIRKYRGLVKLEPVQKLLKEDPSKFASYCNGVGSKVGWFNKILWHFIPNTIWGLNCTASTDLHDVGYAHPAQFKNIHDALAYKDSVDHNFHTNLIKQINKAGGVLRVIRLLRADKYFRLVQECGKEAFLADKIIGEYYEMVQFLS